MKLKNAGNLLYAFIVLNFLIYFFTNQFYYTFYIWGILIIFSSMCLKFTHSSKEFKKHFYRYTTILGIFIIWSSISNKENVSEYIFNKSCEIMLVYLLVYVTEISWREREDSY